MDTTVASAGTGKTYRLVEEIVAEVAGGTAPRRILATTFTKKAAAELAGRIRQKLIEDGRPDLAPAMLSARIGTVKPLNLGSQSIITMAAAGIRHVRKS